MKNRQRNIKKYKPRRRRSDKELQKHQLKDFEHLLEMDLNSFIVLSEEGTPKQAEKAKLKLQSDLMKYGCELEAIGRDLGLGFPELIRNYIQGMNEILKDLSNEIDPALINQHRKQAEHLKKNTMRVDIL